MEPLSLQKLIRPDLLDLEPYRSARDEYGEAREDMVFLDANENPVDSGLNRYPDPYQHRLKERLSKIKSVAPGEIFLGNGSDEVLDLLFRAFCQPGKDNCLVMPPTYGMYGVLAAINRVEVREVPLTPDFQPDVDQVLECADLRSKLLFICSPNNPTANLMDRQRVTRLLERFPGLVVIDEAYWDFTGESSWVARLGRYPNLVVTQTFSKAYGLAGVRLGSCYARTGIVSVLNTIKPPYNVNQLTQDTVLEYLSGPYDSKMIIDTIRDGKESLTQQLVEIPFVRRVFPSDANFVLVRVDDADRRYRQLLDHGIVVRNRSRQPLCENCLRITIGTAEQNSRLIQALKSISS